MREKLNESPMGQVALVAILLVAAGFLLLSQMGGGEEEEAPVAETPAGTTVAPALGEEGVSTTAPASLAVPGGGSGIEVPPLPDPVQRAYDAGKTVVLLFVHDGGIDDRIVRKTVEALSGREDVVVFIVPAKQVARYAAITLGVSLDRVPALVVMRPKGLSDGTQQASVSYGFQSPQAIAQQVRDASYDGPEATYYPN